MQSLGWYMKRLQGMTPEEISWRIRSMVRDHVDRGRIALGRYPSLGEANPPGSAGAQQGYRVSDLLPGEWGSTSVKEPERTWCAALTRRADRIRTGHLSFFDLENRHLGEPIDWNRDHDSGKKAPMAFSPSIDYRDYDVTGDAKLVWEPNRHHQLVVLGRAYRASGDIRYAEAVTDQLESWMSQCPFGKGMNWRSPLELAIRLINWVWAVDLIRESGRVEGDFRARLHHSVYLHLWEISRKYSRGSSANNHLIGEAAGVFIASSYFPFLTGAECMRKQAREILCREIEAQTYLDGCGREQAFGYHLFILQFFLIAGVVARTSYSDFPFSYWSRMERMFEFAATLAGGGDPPMFGDCDDGYVLDLGAGPCNVYDLLSVAAVLFGRTDFKQVSGGYREPARWLIGRESGSMYEAIPIGRGVPLASVAFPESGYYLLQCGHHGESDRISLVFDCGELGYKSIAAHGHADALSFTLRVGGEDVFVDPGTYDYFKYPEWRNHFRKTFAHNTVVLDGMDQSVMIGPFLWGRRAHSKCIAWETDCEGGYVAGEHDGYLHQASPVMHRRHLNLDRKRKTITIRDDVLCGSKHDVTICFRLASDVSPRKIDLHHWEIVISGSAVLLELDSRLSVETYSAGSPSIGGWVSKGYHRKTPATAIVGRTSINENVAFKCRVTIS